MKPVSLKGIILSPKELKDIAKLLAQKRGIKDYKDMSNDKLLSALKVSKNENKTRIDKIRQEIKELDHKLSRQELKEIKKNLYEIQKTKRVASNQKRLKTILIN